MTDHVSRNETEVKKEITDYLRLLGYKVIRCHSGKVRVNGGWMQQNETGTLDYIITGDRFQFFMETKKPGGQLRPEQIDMIKLLEGWGHLVLVADCLDDLVEFLDRYGQDKRQ